MRKRRRRMKVFLSFALAIAVILLIRARLRPYIAELAEMEGRRLGADAITRGVVRVFAGEEPAYGDVVSIGYSDGKVVSLHADAEKLNTLRLAVSDAVADELGIPLKTVSSRIAGAKKRLASALALRMQRLGD